MGLKEKYLKTIMDFKVQNAINAADENIATTIHLMYTHKIDKQKALDQSSRGGNDFGIDGWYYSEKDNHLYVYQSKLTENKGLALAGLSDLINAVNFLEKVIINKEVEKTPTNTGIYNLYIELCNRIESVKRVSLILISPFNDNDIIDYPDYDETEKKISQSKLNKLIDERGGKVSLSIKEYNFERVIPTSYKKYSIKKLKDSVIKLRDNSPLEITFVPLYSLVLLYRQRGDILFHKNVRLSLYGYQDAKNRVVTPMENTLKQICEGTLSPNIFPFYHGGITISATTNTSDVSDEIELETPNVVNGCQTITIAERFYSYLENKKAQSAIEKFNQINVIAKVVIGTNDEELKEITNCNNRQNPIENWQLFVNDPIHLEIEQALLKCEILYERQKGKIKLLKKVEVARDYSKTNNTALAVETLGQIITLVKGEYQLAAKPSEIFINKLRHDSIFTGEIPKYPRDIILLNNLFKAVKTGLSRYLEIPAHNNDETWTIFNKPIVKAYAYRTALLYHYQRYEQDFKFASWLYQKASTNLIEECKSIYSRFILRTKTFYQSELKNSSEVSSKKLTAFFDNLFIELGIDTDNGALPFTKKSIDWSEEEAASKKIDIKDLNFQY